MAPSKIRRSGYTPDVPDVPNLDEWGGAKAQERFGAPRYEFGAPPPEDHSFVQSCGGKWGEAGEPEGPNPFNDTKLSAWTRGGSEMPYFDRGREGRATTKKGR
jgi:hypothetical protein